MALDAIPAVLVNLHTAVIGARPAGAAGSARQARAQAATLDGALIGHAPRLVPHRLGGDTHLRP